MITLKVTIIFPDVHRFRISLRICPGSSLCFIWGPVPQANVLSNVLVPCHISNLIFFSWEIDTSSSFLLFLQPFAPRKFLLGTPMTSFSLTTRTRALPECGLRPSSLW